MIRTEQTKQAENIFYIKQCFNRIAKEWGYPKRRCKKKELEWRCIQCQVGKFLDEFSAYIEWLEDMYKWEFKK